MKVKIYKDAANEYRWQVKAKNGEIVAASTESFKKRKTAMANIEMTHLALWSFLATKKKTDLTGSAQST